MDRPALKPPFAYYGGKTTLASQIADLLPAHDHYVEPFAGSLAVLLAKRPSSWETVNDIDQDLVTFWRVLRERPDELERAMTLTPHSRAEFLLSADLDVTDDVERARRTWVRLTQGRSNSMRHTGWRYGKDAAKGGASRPTYHAGYAARVEAVAKRLIGVTLECRDAIEVIREYGTVASTCLYVDPPYLGSTRATGYAHEMRGDDTHTQLAEALNACAASVVLSGYNSPLYADLFAGWHRVEVKAPIALSNDKDRVEVLWSNRPIGEPDLFGGVA